MLDPIYNELADKVAREFPVGREKKTERIIRFSIENCLIFV